MQNSQNHESIAEEMEVSRKVNARLLTRLITIPPAVQFFRRPAGESIEA